MDDKIRPATFDGGYIVEVYGHDGKLEAEVFTETTEAAPRVVASALSDRIADLTRRRNKAEVEVERLNARIGVLKTKRDRAWLAATLGRKEDKK